MQMPGDFCRACLALKSLMPMKEPLKEKFDTVTQLQVPDKSHLCEECIHNLNDAHSFRLQCINIDKHLKRQSAKEEVYLIVVEPDSTERVVRIPGSTPSPKIQYEDTMNPILDTELPMTDDIEIEISPDDPLGIVDCDISELNVETLGEAAADTAEADDSPELTDDILQPEPAVLCECGEMFTDPTTYYDHPHDRFTCTVCDLVLESKDDIANHMMLHGSKIELEQCKFCDKKMDKRNIMLHVNMNHSRPRPVCPHCKRTFVTEYNCRRHVENIHMRTGEVMREKFACMTCNQRFLSSTSLANHLILHNKESSLQLLHRNLDHELQNLRMAAEDCDELLCPRCGVVLSSKEDVDNHLCSGTEIRMMTYRRGKPRTLTDKPDRSKRGSRTYECKLCPKTFTSAFLMKMHNRVHTNERPFECMHCSSAFKTKSHLMTHLLTHTGVKKFSCPVCNKLFSLKGNLKSHIRMHTGEKPFQCELCINVSFTNPKSLKKHRMKHREIRINGDD